MAEYGYALLGDMVKDVKVKGNARQGMDTLEAKRRALISKRFDIMFGQNTQTAAAYAKTPKPLGKIVI